MKKYIRLGERKGRHAALRAAVARVMLRGRVISSRCAGDPACVWPVVERGLCAAHLRDAGLSASGAGCSTGHLLGISARAVSGW